jgi:hypothetical protein
MAKKVIQNILNELISESEKKTTVNDLSRIVSLDLPVVTINIEMVSVDLKQIIIFNGIETIISKLLEEIKESCFFGQSDVSVNVNVERDICPQLYNYGIHKIFFYSPIENVEQLPYLYKEIVNQLRYIFNALQSPGINKGFFEQTEGQQNGINSLLFPFNREVESDKTGLHYLVEKVSGSHFLRITVEELNHSRLNMRHIDHRLISNIELIDDFMNIHTDANTIYSSMISRCRDNKLSFKDSGLQLSDLIRFLKKAKYTNLREITVNWPHSVIDELLTGSDQEWNGCISRLLLILSDSTTNELLESGKTIEMTFEGARAYLSLTQRHRNLQIDLQEKVLVSGLDEYLSKMERLQSMVEKCKNRLDDVHLIFIHHFTSETLAVLGAFDRLVINVVDTLWVKYSGSIPSKYIETIMSLPSSVYRFYGLQQLNDKHYKTRFCLSDRYSPIDEFTSLSRLLDQEENEFYGAMQLMGMHLFLNAVSDKTKNKKVIIAEDGGYLAPLINRLSLENLSVGEVFTQFGYENTNVTVNERSLFFGEWIKPCFVGSVEHTRNGYDALMVVEGKYNRLAFPACSLAISKFKVHDESVEVACSCLNSIENILNGQGFVLNNRKCLVLGSLGAIGIQTMKILVNRVGEKNLAGIDIQSDENQKRDWLQVSTHSMLPVEFKYSVDLIFGVIGKSILNIEFFEDLILNTERKIIFLASGSTKRFEFIDFLNWTAKLLSLENPAIKGIPVKVTSSTIEDPQTSAVQGTIISFEVEMKGRQKKVDIYILSNGMPVNFQYYGVPTETMDSVMTEFVSLVNVFSNARENALPAKVLALDHAIDLEGNLK